MDQATLPIAVIGAGPVGLAATAHLIAAGEHPVVLEAGDQVGAAVAQWGQVQLFTRWDQNLDREAATLLSEHGWVPPDGDSHPTGQELVDRYLVPLAELPRLAPHIHLGSRVVSVTRAGVDKLRSAGRLEAPFALRVRDRTGERDLLARAVIDASGTWSTPNPIGGSGVPAIGEATASAQIRYGIPDVGGADRHRYAARTVLVVGSGHSAFGCLTDLSALAEQEPGTSIHWAVRRPSLEEILGPKAPDALPQRAQLAERVKALVAAGILRVHSNARIEKVEKVGDRVRVLAAGRLVAEVDEVIVATGFRPDGSLLGELRLALDPALECPAALAPLINPNEHTCGTVPAHGVGELSHPDEPGLYIVGMKSYGRAPTALLMTAYEQVRSVVAALLPR